MSHDHSPQVENDNSDEVSSASKSTANSDNVVPSRSSLRRSSMGARRTSLGIIDSGGVPLSKARQQQRTPDPNELTSIGQHTPRNNRHKMNSRNAGSGRAFSADDEINYDAGSSGRNRDRAIRKDRSPVPSNQNIERRDSSDPSRQRTGHRRGDQRSSDRELRNVRERRKPTRFDGEDENNTSRPSSSATLGSSRNRKSSSSTTRLEDLADDSSNRSDPRKDRSSSNSVSSGNQPSPSLKHRNDREKGTRPSRNSNGSGRRERSPRHSKEALDPPKSEGSFRKKISVTEDEIMALLGATYDGNDNRKSISPRPERKSSGMREGHARRSHGGTRDGSRTKMSRRASNGTEYRVDRTERDPRVPPRRSRSDDIGTDGNGLDNFFQHDGTAVVRKKGHAGSKSVASWKSNSGAKSIATTRSTQSRRRRHDVNSGKLLKGIKSHGFEEEHLSDDMEDSGMIVYDDYKNYDDDRTIDLDLATARAKFAQQNVNERLQLHLNKTDELLYSVFPKHVANALRNGQKVEPENHDLVTIFFSDIVGFTDISAKLDPLKISDMLDRLYNSFDALSDYHDVFKVETIGDAYMAVTNLTKEQPDHCKRITEFAIDAIRVANQTLVDEENPSMGFVNIRVGFHSGSVVSNVVGTRNPRYCLFGDTVNTASRMESNSQKNRIHCSEVSAILLRDQCPRMRIYPRGTIEVKGKGDMKTFWIHTEGSMVPKDKKNGTIRNFMKSVRKK